MSIIKLHSSRLCSLIYRAINCLTNDNLINNVNPKIDRMLPLVPKVDSLIKQFQNLSSQLNAKFDKLPKEFQDPDMAERSQQLKRTAEAMIVAASTIIESQSTIVGGRDGEQPPQSISGELLESLRKRKVEEWISQLTVSHGEREQEYDTGSELTPDDSVSSIGSNKKKRSQQIVEAGMPGPSLGADKSAGTLINVSTGRENLIENVFMEEFTHSSHIEEIPSSSEEDSDFDEISENTLTEYRADHNVDISYDEKSTQELLAVLATECETKEWTVNDLLLDLAKMKAGPGVRSTSNIVGRTLLYLLEMGADVNAMDAKSQTSLHRASRVGNIAVVEQLVERNADLNMEDEDGWTALGVAASEGRTSTVECLLKAGASIDARNGERDTPLIRASSGGYVRVVEALLKAGALIDTGNDKGNIPLIWASRNGHIEVVETLLKAGASIDTANNKRWTPLIEASYKGHVGVVKTLLKAGGVSDSKSENGRRALKRSTYRGHKPITELLLDAGADIKARSKSGNTVLHEVLCEHYEDCTINQCAFCAGSETRQDMVKLLCEKGADPSAKNRWGDSPLSLVYEEGAFSRSEQEALAKLLKSFRAE